ncbi:hypothetical protein SAMN05421810_110152 [Amycolatopsis arida]|uniref:Asp23 family, cell envelope-related function n=1 Tax=Amycolatopsis arida TaxID=587909 RepID=A0A1I5ZVH8_9PSEU|nr:hypothetical protein [Amycolatopsis arida]TDX89385.1 hypothetical protein CLV69_110153 [Amycolatopsis arida]SFQ60247.1 hypothetical protein SAMN05421810_110152 [Amycolatopsis arida]
MATRGAGTDEGPAEDPAETIAREVLAHPAVVRLDGGPLGVVATHLPGRRVTGVRVPDDGAPVEVGVVLRLGEPLPELTEQVRHRVRGVVGTVPVDIVVSDVVEPEPATGGER